MIRIVGLSATLSNLEDFAEWLSDVREAKVHVVIERKRAVPLAFQIATKERGLVPASDIDHEYKQWHKHAIKNIRHQGNRRHKGARKQN